MVGRNINITTQKEFDNHIKHTKFMPLKNWEEITIDNWDEDNWERLTKQKKTMKNIFLDVKSIKKQKFTPEIAKKIKFAEITPFMSMKDATEGYLGAYAESEFFAWRFQQLHNFYPDHVRISYLKSEKFLIDFFKYCKIPENSYYKSYEEKRGEINLNISMFAFDTGRDDKLYMYLDDGEAMFFYNKADEKNPESLLNILISLLKNKVEPAQQKNKIYVVYQSSNGFEKTGFDVKKITVNLEENYNDGFAEVSQEIIDGLNDKKKTNLVILSGDPGTGKTTYIRYLTSKIKKNIIFIAPDMVNHITDPSFIPFLIKNNDAVLIIEDAEPALQNRDGNGRTGAVSNVLNLTDGLLSDCLNISIVATFNTSGRNIDPALLRKGRLLKNYKFDKLSKEKSKALLKKLGREDVEVKETMTLADIYYEGDNNSGEFEKRKVGF